ncbi:hypothetical protein [Prevotella sp. CAG:592]|uniref:hypothetical protein n=1 Tax=Prevotella sp. CAG:592 TaxID=1262931 RepID=UPI002583DBED|nr:hypothetical protein [Prevotella sp. CAG:592]
MTFHFVTLHIQVLSEACKPFLPYGGGQVWAAVIGIHCLAIIISPLSFSPVEK